MAGTNPKSQSQKQRELREDIIKLVESAIVLRSSVVQARGRQQLHENLTTYYLRGLTKEFNAKIMEYGVRNPVSKKEAKAVALHTVEKLKQIARETNNYPMANMLNREADQIIQTGLAQWEKDILAAKRLLRLM